MNNLPPNLILKCLGGSRAYGTANENSDVDYRGIFAAPARSILTPFYPLQEIRYMEDADEVYYELEKFMGLLRNQNPSILEILWADDVSIISTTPEGEQLRKMRHNWLSKRCYDSFGGYATSELGRVKRSFAAKISPENPHGYDTKNAMHMVRLMRMGKEILIEGKVNVKRTDADELLEIRNGKFTFPEVVEMAESLLAELRAAFNACDLPEEVDKESLAESMLSIYPAVWGYK